MTFPDKSALIFCVLTQNADNEALKLGTQNSINDNPLASCLSFPGIKLRNMYMKRN